MDDDLSIFITDSDDDSYDAEAACWMLDDSSSKYACSKSKRCRVTSSTSWIRCQKCSFEAELAQNNRACDSVDQDLPEGPRPAPGQPWASKARKQSELNFGQPDAKKIRTGSSEKPAPQTPEDANPAPRRDPLSALTEAKSKMSIRPRVIDWSLVPESWAPLLQDWRGLMNPPSI
ncbi:unnamed protein product [Prorocentrum cordatum]|uniref:Uncharacterized protein n=1 Tax=Prorocentrum cordatum TaxID=2364126 RepID=A0ABN9PYY8_9DINO|nr:unnamed protein product [Polarella glacialis]